MSSDGRYLTIHHLNMAPGSSSPCTYWLDLYQRLVFRLTRDSWAVRGWW